MHAGTNLPPSPFTGQNCLLRIIAACLSPTMLHNLVRLMGAAPSCSALCAMLMDTFVLQASRKRQAAQWAPSRAPGQEAGPAGRPGMQNAISLDDAAGLVGQPTLPSNSSLRFKRVRSSVRLHCKLT